MPICLYNILEDNSDQKKYFPCLVGRPRYIQVLRNMMLYVAILSKIGIFTIMSNIKKIYVEKMFFLA